MSINAQVVAFELHPSVICAQILFYYRIINRHINSNFCIKVLFENNIGSSNPSPVPCLGPFSFIAENIDSKSLIAGLQRKVE